MESWKKYLEKRKDHKNLLESYTKLRMLIQSYDWSDSDLVNPPFYSGPMMAMRDSVISESSKLLEKLKTIGFEVDPQELLLYLQEYMNKIDKLIPLKNGNNKRGNQRDEDY